MTSDLVKNSLEPLAHPWFYPGEPPVILGVGRLVQQKDFPLLIRAFSRLRKRREARLMILGEGPLRPELEALVETLDLKKDISLPGFIANPYAYMRCSALFILSSRWEGFGNVLVEAMACGTPVVSTDCPSGPSEILENGKWGRLVPVGDVNAMAFAMESALIEPSTHDTAMRAADFSVEQAISSYIQVLLTED
ncbi:MAG: glycosyltransferase [Chlorobiales bacterium]|nr:glycosyltransferase [Chlorobiales bacterium]